MTAAQSSKYFAEFGHLRDVLKARGWSPTKIEQHRHAITRKALGHDKSSRDFTNAELDKVLAVITAERAPADFDAQMKIQDMPEKRVCLLVHRIDALSRRIGLEPDRERSYVDGISRRMFGKQYHDLPERGLQQIEGILRRRLRQRGLTVEQIDAIEKEVAEHAEKMVGIVAPEIERQRAKQPAAAHVEEDEFNPAAPFG